MSYWLSFFRDWFSVLMSEACLSEAPRAKTVALQAFASFFSGFGEFLKATLCFLRPSVGSAFFRREIGRDSWSGYC